MGDPSQQSDTSSDDDEQTPAIVYTCRKCKGLELSTDQLDEHREFHRDLRAKKKDRAKRQKREGSQNGAASTTGTATSDLFTHKEVPKPKKKAAEKARLKRAKARYQAGAAKTMGVRYKGV